MNGIFRDFISNLSAKNNISCQVFKLDPFPLALFQNVSLNRDSSIWEFSDLMLNQKVTDLYSLFQTPEINDIEIRNFFLDFFCSSETRGLKFNGIYLSSQIYKGGSFLLCHDDQFDDRIFAFVFYLSDVNDYLNGGLLDFFEDSYKSVPFKVSFSLIPKKHSLILFEVSPRSFHQVSEFLSNKIMRKTIGGWIRGRYVPSSENLSNIQLCGTIEACLNSISQYRLVIEPCGMFFYTPVNLESEFYFSFDIFLFDHNCFLLHQNSSGNVDFLTYSNDSKDYLSRFKNTSFLAVNDKVSKVSFSHSLSIVPGIQSFYLLKGYKK